ncbi:MAG TPA: 50S ribosomal protein L11 methyltransferase [Candidatus Limnocylindria bacterium]|nr:50S ribosomal protein L11 methyltransferase [Candidatus Limnocylindria bacterium]
MARWLELTVEVDSEAVEAVSEILGRLGHGAAVRPTRLLRDPGDELAVREDATAPYELTAHLPDDDGAPEAIDRTERALWHLQAFGLRPVGPLRVRTVEESDWTDAWKKGYEPQRIGRLLIVPSWLESPARTDDVVLRLDPGMAFGTGLHPTTRACLALLQQVGPMPPRVLDVGSGSGILGIAALALGAERVDAIDTDPVAVEATLSNAAANGMAARVSARVGTLEGATTNPYPLVLANLVAAVLVRLASPLAAHAAQGGTLLASGIIAERGDEVAAALTAAGLAEDERLGDGEWVSLRMHRA